MKTAAACTALLFSALLAGCGESAPSTSCENFAISEFLSPAGSTKVVFFERRCKKLMQGGDFSSSHASIIPATATLGNEDGNILIVSGGANQAKWTSENSIEIDYFGKAELLKDSYKGISIVTHDQTSK